MAHVAHANPVGFGLSKALSDFFALFWNATRMQAEMDDRMRQMKKLEAMSDADLAERGIARDRIVHHVFRDLYYV